ncbi:MAG: hypothetical protein M3N59_03410 [bacterium]|nr:hypothetical protein [bacterium]
MAQAIDDEQLRSDIESAVELQVWGSDAYLVLDAHHLDLEEGRFDLSSTERRAVANAVADLYEIPMGDLELANAEPLTEFRSPSQDVSLYRLFDGESVTYYLAMPNRTTDDFVSSGD